MASISGLFSGLSHKGVAWLETHVPVLDDSILEFAKLLYSAYIKDKELCNDDVVLISSLICKPDFCGLSLSDVYNIVAHEEHALDWEFLDDYNKECATLNNEKYSTRYILNFFKKYVNFYTSEDGSLEELFQEDDDVAFITLGGVKARHKLTPCVNNASEASLDALINSDYWVGLQINEGHHKIPSNWKPGSPPGVMSGYTPTAITSDGIVSVKHNGYPYTITRKYSVIFVPANKLELSSAKTNCIRTFLPEEIVDKYNLPKAIY